VIDSRPFSAVTRHFTNLAAKVIIIIISIIIIVYYAKAAQTDVCPDPLHHENVVFISTAESWSHAGFAIAGKH